MVMAMSKFSINDLIQTTPQQPGGQIEYLDTDELIESESNHEIYTVADLNLLAADIEQRGVRSPLEVVQTAEGWRVVSGHRRLAACKIVEARRGRHMQVPCIVVEYASSEDELLALVMANATARELSDWEKLRQYEVLHRIFTAKKQRGELGGSMRQALADALGESSGGMARLQYVAAKADEDTRAQLRAGKISLNQAYSMAHRDSAKTLPQNSEATAEKKICSCEYARLVLGNKGKAIWCRQCGGEMTAYEALRCVAEGRASIQPEE